MEAIAPTACDLSHLGRTNMHDRPVNLNSIETVSGHFIDLLDPSPDDIFIEDIAWALSKMPRYAGHTLPLLTYSVAQHSVVVFNLVNRLRNPKEVELLHSFITFSGTAIEHDEITYEVLLETLMHDSSEAYLLDIPTPLKHLPGMKEAYGGLEVKMMAAIRAKFRMPEPSALTHMLVKWADMYALTIEAYHLMKSRGKNWNKLLPVSLPALQQFENPKPAQENYEDFVGMFEELQHMIASQYGNQFARAD